MPHDLNEPYYHSHKVVELTCPRCEAMLTFMVNDGETAIYSCNCGRWFKQIDRTMTAPNTRYTWRYEALDRYKK